MNSLTEYIITYTHNTYPYCTTTITTTTQTFFIFLLFPNHLTQWEAQNGRKYRKEMIELGKYPPNTNNKRIIIFFVSVESRTGMRHERKFTDDDGSVW